MLRHDLEQPNVMGVMRARADIDKATQIEMSLADNRGHMIKSTILTLVDVSWRLAVALLISFGLVFVVTRFLGEDKFAWGLMALAWVMAHLGEFKDIAGSSTGVFKGDFLKRIAHYYRNVNYARFWFRLAEWAVAGLAAYVISQMSCAVGG